MGFKGLPGVVNVFLWEEVFGAFVDLMEPVGAHPPSAFQLDRPMVLSPGSNQVFFCLLRQRHQSIYMPCRPLTLSKATLR